jgi:hypothetical protein
MASSTEWDADFFGEQEMLVASMEHPIPKPVARKTDRRDNLRELGFFISDLSNCGPAQ